MDWGKSIHYYQIYIYFFFTIFFLNDKETERGKNLVIYPRRKRGNIQWWAGVGFAYKPWSSFEGSWDSEKEGNLSLRCEMIFEYRLQIKES